VKTARKVVLGFFIGPTSSAMKNYGNNFAGLLILRLDMFYEERIDRKP
jgi:hypothetical protein